MNWHNVANAVLFQITWFACVLGGADGHNLWGVVSLTVLAGHALTGGQVARDVLLATAAAPVGFVLDTVWIRLGVLDYADVALAPAWIVMLWVAVALTVNHCLSWLRSRPWLGGLLAGASAPLSYLAGQALGAVTVPSLAGLVAIAVVWLALFALVFHLAGAASRRGPTAVGAAGTVTGPQAKEES